MGSERVLCGRSTRKDFENMADTLEKLHGEFKDVVNAKDKAEAMVTKLEGLLRNSGFGKAEKSPPSRWVG